MEKKPLKEKEEVTEKKEIRLSTTDSECGFISRENKQEMFCYLDHRTTDMKFNIITDAYVTPGNVWQSLSLFPPVDWSGRCEDSCGSTGLGRPRRRLSAEEAPRHARGKRSTWSGNQQAIGQVENKNCRERYFLDNLRSDIPFGYHFFFIELFIFLKKLVEEPFSIL
jgi:hypothetical protein